MQHKTSELVGYRLDLAVALAEGIRAEPVLLQSLKDDGSPNWPAVETCKQFDSDGRMCGFFNPSTSWNQGGLIVERERVAIFRAYDGGEWFAVHDGKECIDGQISNDRCEVGKHGSTPLVAAMRAYVAAHFGDEVSLP